MKVKTADDKIIISKDELRQTLRDLGFAAEDEWRYDRLLALSSTGEVLNGLYQELNDGIYFEEEDDGELYASLLDKVNHPDQYEDQIETFEDLKLRITDLEHKNNKLKYELYYRAWIHALKSDIKFRLEEIYGIRKTDKWLEDFANKIWTSDYTNEVMNNLIDSFLEGEGVVAL